MRRTALQGQVQGGTHDNSKVVQTERGKKKRNTDNSWRGADRCGLEVMMLGDVELKLNT